MAGIIDRRWVLFGGVGAVVAASAGTVRNAEGSDEFPTSGDAYAPWREWRIGEASSINLVRAAILAANAHDTQPWLFCVFPDRIDIMADERRNLGMMDPFRREMHLSLGCAIENMTIAARAGGYDTRVYPLPGSLTDKVRGPRLAARIELRRGPREVSPLAMAIAKRHTNRAAYDGDRPLGEAFTRLRQVATGDNRVQVVWFTDTKVKAEFVAATVAATEAIVADPEMIADSDAWFRASDMDIEAHRDGPTLYAAGLSPFTLFLARLMPSVSPARAHQTWIDNTREIQLASAAGFGAIAVRDLYDREQALAAGRLWQRLHLTAVTLGLAMQPLNQLPERIDRERRLGKAPVTMGVLASLLREPDRRATFTFRFGWPLRSAPASPRRDLSAVLEDSGCAA